MPAPTANAYMAPTPTTPIASTGPWIPSPLLPRPALAAKSIIAVGHSAWWEIVAALVSPPAYSHRGQRPSALSCVRQFLLSCRTWLPPGVEAAERARKRLHTVTCYHPSRQDGWRDTDWFKTHVPDQTPSRPHFIQSANDLCRPRSMIVRAPRLNFHLYGWAAGP